MPGFKFPKVPVDHTYLIEYEDLTGMTFTVEVSAQFKSLFRKMTLKAINSHQKGDGSGEAVAFNRRLSARVVKVV